MGNQRHEFMEGVQVKSVGISNNSLEFSGIRDGSPFPDGPSSLLQDPEKSKHKSIVKSPEQRKHQEGGNQRGKPGVSNIQAIIHAYDGRSPMDPDTKVNVSQSIDSI